MLPPHYAVVNILSEMPEGGFAFEAEVFGGNRLDLWARSQGDWVKMP